MKVFLLFANEVISTDLLQRKITKILNICILTPYLFLLDLFFCGYKYFKQQSKFFGLFLKRNKEKLVRFGSI